MPVPPVAPVPPTGLPVEDAVAEVRAALGEDGAGHAVLVAPPGAGKTTVVPLRLLGAPWLGDQRIVVLEPRRLAARAAARRMAELLGEEVGATVGYRTRDERVVGRRMRIEVVTEGILVRRLQDDPGLAGTGLVVLDEVHERNLVTDLSLALLLDARAGLRPDLRVLAMSATVDADRLAAVVGGTDGPAPVVRSDGRQFPVAVRHHPPEARDRPEAHAARVVGRALADDPDGDVLVFLPGAAEIRRVGDRLRAAGALPVDVDVRPLYGALPKAEQDRALDPSPVGRRRVVLATDIAESSLTVAGVRVVVDAGLVRAPRFDVGTGLTRLRTEPASRAASDQRAGRAGRLGPGVAHRLWAASDAGRRPAYPTPEIAAVDLAGFVLELAVWGTDPAELALIDQPPARALEEARALLAVLGALDGRGRPTPLGRRVAGLPLHPRLATVAMAGVERGAAWTGVVVAALLEERDVLRGRPDERSVDLLERAALVADDRARHPEADAQALRTTRRRARELARRLDVRPGHLDPEAVGPLAAVGYPDRIAQARGGGTFRLRGGGGGRVPGPDPLAAAPFLVVADVEAAAGDGRIRLAAALDETDVRRAVGDQVEEVATVAWDAARNDLRARTETRAGALVLARTEGPATPGEATTVALLDHVRATDGAALAWTPAARSLQERLGFLHQLEPDAWPDVTDASLLAELDDWLAPHLPGATGRRDLARVDLVVALRARLDRRQQQALAQRAPTSFDAADGRAVAIAYDTGRPVAATRVQDLFGLTRHPTVDEGRVPVVLHLLSPAGRPVQVTADLPGFWAGSWVEVRKELAGRYPKHAWPADPANAVPGRGRRNR